MTVAKRARGMLCLLADGLVKYLIVQLDYSIRYVYQVVDPIVPVREPSPNTLISLDQALVSGSIDRFSTL